MREGSVERNAEKKRKGNEEVLSIELTVICNYCNFAFIQFCWN